jgi:hypothetical protein
MKQIGCLACVVVLLAGCSSDEPPHEDIDVIIARSVRPDSVVVERPDSNGLFRVRMGSVSGGIGQPHGGGFRFEGKERSFQYPAVEGKYYVVTALTDENGEISLLTILFTPTSDTDSPKELQILSTDLDTDNQ